tara:strand:- start:446 stop:601 length:156 start_codon:yes stop_codon:yes gene_type:complete
MDYLILFVIGYVCRDAWSYLKNLLEKINFEKEYRTILELDQEWKWNSDDLP